MATKTNVQKNIKLNKNQYAVVDDEDYVKLSKFKWCLHKGKYTYYVARSIYKSNKIYMHREIMNCPDGKFIDHINGDGLDNRKENLRICTITQNAGNMRIPKHNKSGIKGVCWDKTRDKWIASISMKNKTKFLGRYVNIIDAKKAYDKAAKDYFGLFYSEGISL